MFRAIEPDFKALKEVLNCGFIVTSKSSKTDLIAYQASERGGVLKIRIEGDRVMIGGKAITVLRGELNC